jgi:hypothetical protein
VQRDRIETLNTNNMEQTIEKKLIIIDILAKDIMETSYTNAFDCAITRALRRVIGDDSIMHSGIDIQKDFTFRPTEFIDSPGGLNERVLSMYAFKHPEDELWDNYERTEPSDFSFQLEVPAHWVAK